MNIIKSILTKNPCYTSGRKITVKGLMLHSVGCNQPSAQVFVKGWNSESHDSSCVHAFIDANTGDIYQCLPWNHRGWHGGGASNNTHIGVEMCEPNCIKYKSNGYEFTCSDMNKAKEMVKKTYDAAVELFAYLCKEYNLDPLAKGVIISHNEGHELGIASNHGDPEHLWDGLKMGYTMNGFRNDVAKKMGVEQKKVIYKVQIGAYSVKSNAETQLMKIKSAGFKDAYIVNIDGFYKVQVGAYSVRSNADAMMTKIKKLGFNAIIKTY